jgi:antitoxin CptB
MDELAKLKWQCRRGTRELDLLLNDYLENRFIKANPAEQSYFLEILKLEDSILLAQIDQLAKRLGGVDF